MSLSEHCSVELPHYKLADDLQKDNLFNYCMNHETIKHYLPDYIRCEYIERNLLLSVSLIIIISLFTFATLNIFKS